MGLAIRGIAPRPNNVYTRENASAAGKPKILRPNAALITQLRGFPITGPRPLEIRTIVLVNAYANVIGKLVDYIRGKLQKVSGVEPDVIAVEDLESSKLSANGTSIITACTLAEIDKIPRIVRVLSPDVIFCGHNKYGDNKFGINGEQIAKEVRGSGYKGYFFGMASDTDEGVKSSYMTAGADLVLSNSPDPVFIYTFFK